MLELIKKYLRIAIRSKTTSDCEKGQILRDLARFDDEILCDIGIPKERFEEAADVWIQKNGQR